MFCSRCKMANADTRQACTKCGAKLPLGRSTTRNFNLGTATATAVALAPVAESSPKVSPAPTARTAPPSLPIPTDELAAAPIVHEPLWLGIQRENPTFITSRPATNVRPVPASKPAQKPKSSRKALASFVCGVLFPILPTAIAAIVFGRRARAEIRESHNSLRGASMATAGVVLGWVGVALFTAVFTAELFSNFVVSPAARNQTAAIGTLHSMNTALIAYGSGYGNGFPSNIATLASGDPGNGDCNHAAMIDPRLGDGRKDGYIFRYTPVFPDHRTTPQISPKAAAANCTSGGASGYTITADPAVPGKSGATHFFTDQTGVIRFSSGDSPATAGSDTLQ